jgi:hypothetical protein
LRVISLSADLAFSASASALLPAFPLSLTQPLNQHDDGNY